MPDFLVGPSQTNTTIQAAIDAVAAIGDLTGLGDHNIIIDNGFVFTGVLDTTATQAATDGRIYIKSSGWWTYEATDRHHSNQYITMSNYIGYPTAGYAGGNLGVFNDSLAGSSGVIFEYFIVHNPHVIDTTAFRASADWRDVTARDGVVYGFNDSFKSAVVNIQTVERVTADDCYNGILGGTNVKDCVATRITSLCFNGTMSYCASSDSTATGTGSITNIVATDEFTDPDNGDFTLKVGSQLLAAGSTGNNIGQNQDPAPFAPSVTTDPVNETLLGSSANFITFTAAADGFPAPTVQWQKDTKGDNSFSNVSGATSESLIVLGTETVFAINDGDQYRAVFTNSEGVATTALAILTVTDPGALSISDTTPLVSGSQVLITLINGGTPNKTVTYGGHPVNVSSQTSTEMVIDNWIFLHKDITVNTLDYTVSHDLIVTGGSETSTVSLPTNPRAGDYYFDITGDPWDVTSIFYDDPVALVDGDKCYAIVESGTIDDLNTFGTPTNPSSGAIIKYALFDVSVGDWGTVATEIYAIGELDNTSPVILKRNPNENNFLMGEYPNGNAPVFEGFKYSLILDDISYLTMPVVRPQVTPPDGDLWLATDYHINGTFQETTLSITQDDSVFGPNSLSLVREEGDTPTSNMYQMIYYNNRSEGNANNWHYLRELFPSWQNGKINRIRFWMKLPLNITRSAIEQTNFHFGTYLRDSLTSRLSNESDNHHHYHYYNIGTEGSMWQQVIVDSHPSHQRSANGDTEQSTEYEPMPDADPGLNYFDLMTYFYLQQDTSVEPAAFPIEFLFDGFEMYEDPYDEDIEQIYSLTGVYNDVTDEILVSWKRDKRTSSKTFDVRYAFTSFHKSGGFGHGTAAPNGTGVQSGLPDYEPTGYNGVDYRNGDINIVGKDFIFIAIQHEDSPIRFREIRIPLTTNGYPIIGGQV